MTRVTPMEVWPRLSLETGPDLDLEISELGVPVSQFENRPDLDLDM